MQRVGGRGNPQPFLLSSQWMIVSIWRSGKEREEDGGKNGVDLEKVKGMHTNSRNRKEGMN